MALADIAGFVRRSRHATTFDEHVQLQRDLARYAWDVYGFDRELTQRTETLRAEIPTAKAAGDLDRVRTVSKVLDEYKLALAANKRRWSALRLVQDGIFWRTLRFDRFLIGVLGLGPPVTWLSRNFPSEIAAAEEHWNARRLALFCDLSGCINTGDLLVIDGAGPSIQLIEVKEADRSSEETRQFERMRQRVELLNTGMSDAFGPHRLFRPPENSPRLRTYLSNLRDAFDRTKSEGAVLVKVGDAYSLTVIDALAARTLGEHEEQAALFLRRRERHSRLLGAAWAHEDS